MTQFLWTFRTVSALSATDMNFGERLSYSLRMLVVGLGMVFASLCLLWLVLVISRYFLYDLPAKKKASKDALAEAVAKVAVPLPDLSSERPVVTGSEAGEDEIVAAITAAICAVRAEEGATGGFRVVSFRRADKGTAWNRKS